METIHKNKQPVGVALFSGGLDSTLAAIIAVDAGAKVIAVNFITPFCDCTPDDDCSVDPFEPLQRYGIELKRIKLETDYIEEVLKYPDHGYGQWMNPCIDCHIYFILRAKDYMKEIGADFVITGEVVGQRPMSQMKPILAMIDKETDLRGKILRPLSAKILPETEMEKDGLIDRDKLHGISGRSRKEQMALAEKYGVKEYYTPAGGCLLTDPGFSIRLKELIEYKPDYNTDDINRLKVGRHFRVDGVKVIVGRDEKNNDIIHGFYQPEDDYLVEVVDYPSPLTLVEKGAPEGVIKKAGSITARYTKGRKEERVLVSVEHNGTIRQVEIAPFSEDEVESYMVKQSVN
ncbi:MAG: DUF814 domain-containing protein [candidate division Zixibacteria bacterium]|nr:DUF814 domain-containing protein [candidate division Zixibacteria bacterium]